MTLFCDNCILNNIAFLLCFLETVLVVGKDRVLDIIQRRFEIELSFFEVEILAKTAALKFCKQHVKPGSVIKMFTDAMQVMPSAMSRKRILRFTRKLQGQILHTCDMSEIDFHWVKSHSVNEGNRRVDKYAWEIELFPRNNSKKILSWKDTKK